MKYQNNSGISWFRYFIQHPPMGSSAWTGSGPAQWRSSPRGVGFFKTTTTRTWQLREAVPSRARLKVLTMSTSMAATVPFLSYVSLSRIATFAVEQRQWNLQVNSTQKMKTHFLSILSSEDLHGCISFRDGVFSRCFQASSHLYWSDKKVLFTEKRAMQYDITGCKRLLDISDNFHVALEKRRRGMVDGHRQ